MLDIPISARSMPSHVRDFIVVSHHHDGAFRRDLRGTLAAAKADAASRQGGSEYIPPCTVVVWENWRGGRIHVSTTPGEWRIDP